MDQVLWINMRHNVHGATCSTIDDLLLAGLLLNFLLHFLGFWLLAKLVEEVSSVTGGQVAELLGEGIVRDHGLIVEVPTRVVLNLVLSMSGN